MAENDKARPTGAGEHGPLFNELRTAITKHTAGGRRDRLLARLDHLEKSVNTSSFGSHLAAFVEEAKEEAAAIGPLMSRLSNLLP